MLRYIVEVNEGNYRARVVIDSILCEDSFVKALGNGMWFKDKNSRRVNPNAVIYVNPPYELAKSLDDYKESENERD